MKIRKIAVLLLLIILPIIIYTINVNKNIYYLSLGDSLALGQGPYTKVGYGYSDYVKNYLEDKRMLEFYTKDYAVSGYRITDLIKDINHNKKIRTRGKSLTIKNALAKADVVTLSIGGNDLIYKLGAKTINNEFTDIEEFNMYVDEVLVDLEQLIYLMRKYCKEDIILIGYYNPVWHSQSTYAKKIEPTFIYANGMAKKIAKEQNVYYVDIYEDFKNNNDYLPNPIDIHPSSRGYNAIAEKIIHVIEKKY